jgi:hypothetical protein
MTYPFVFKALKRCKDTKKGREKQNNLVFFQMFGLSRVLAGIIHATRLQQSLLSFIIAETKHILKHACATIHQFSIRQLHLYHPIAFNAT